jgi:hypothetical protein
MSRKEFRSNPVHLECQRCQFEELIAGQSYVVFFGPFADGLSFENRLVVIIGVDDPLQ